MGAKQDLAAETAALAEEIKALREEVRQQREGQGHTWVLPAPYYGAPYWYTGWTYYHTLCNAGGPVGCSTWTVDCSASPCAAPVTTTTSTATFANLGSLDTSGIGTTAI